LEEYLHHLLSLGYAAHFIYRSANKGHEGIIQYGHCGAIILVYLLYPLQCVPSQTYSSQQAEHWRSILFFLSRCSIEAKSIDLTCSAFKKSEAEKLLDPKELAIHQLFNIILKLRILVLLPVSTMPYVVKVKNYS
jgi:hypothetical protein